MRALLLGGNGQLGTDINAVCGSDLDLINLGRDVLDVADTQQVTDVLGQHSFDVLVNCTSYHKTDEVEDNASHAVAVNAHAVAAMARSCEAQKAVFVHISTDYVYGGQALRSPLNEAMGPAPLNVYGASKLLGENLAAQACANLYVLRVASLFGVAGASGKGGNFVETMLRIGRDQGKLSVVDDQIMSPTSTADIAGWILPVLHNAEPGVYHCVNSGAASWYEFACEIIKKANVDAEVSPVSSAEFATRAMRPPYSVLDNHKLASVLGHAPRPWQDALGAYLERKGHV